MSKELADGVLAIVQAATTPLIDEIKSLRTQVQAVRAAEGDPLADAVMDAIGGVTEPLHQRLLKLEAHRGSTKGHDQLEQRIQALETLLGLTSKAAGK